MSHKKHKKKRKAPEVKRTTSGQRVINEIMLTICFGLMLFVLYSQVPGYKFVMDRLVIKHFKTWIERPKAPIKEKFEARLGFDFKYLDFIKENTPEEAIILMPPEEIFLQGDFNKNGNWGAKNITWATYFLYPRVLVREGHPSFDRMGESITHIMVVHEWGYHKANYLVREKHKYTILTVK